MVRRPNRTSSHVSKSKRYSDGPRHLGCCGRENPRAPPSPSQAPLAQARAPVGRTSGSLNGAEDALLGFITQFAGAVCDPSSMTPDREYEYDLAVSFAGEDREYVRAIVRGLGDDIRVFYDEDEKSKLWGENLADLFMDLYENQSRYVLMIVSTAYAAKMWTHLERQSAMARAMKQAAPYILPVRMDDTELPGLLHTVGYLDARQEGIDGVISILREKLGEQRAAADYDGRVPMTEIELERLLAIRPALWEYWLYAGALRIGLDALEDKFRDYDLGYAPMSGEVFLDDEAMRLVRSGPTAASALVENFNALLTPAAQDAAFGRPGEPGDAAKIMHLARRMVDTYEAFLDNAARLRGAAVPDAYRPAILAAARFGSDAIMEFRRFVADAVDTLGSLPEALADATPENPVRLDLTLTMTVSDAVLEEFSDALRIIERAHNR